jgi:hypothetical protein
MQWIDNKYIIGDRRMNMENWWNDTGPGKKEVLEEESCPGATLSTTSLTWTDLAFEPVSSRWEAGDKPCEPWHGLLFDWHRKVLFLDCLKPQATKSFETSRTTHPSTRRNIPYEYSYKNAGQRVIFPKWFCLILTYFYFNSGDLI